MWYMMPESSPNPGAVPPGTSGTEYFWTHIFLYCGILECPSTLLLVFWWKRQTDGEDMLMSTESISVMGQNKSHVV